MTRSRGRATRPAARRTTTGAMAKRRAPAAGTRAKAKLAPGRQAAKLTTDHERIRKWVEARGGHPATVKRTAKGKQSAGVLRIDFPGFSGAQSLREISWGEFFEVFDDRNLAFLYQERTASGKPSRFNKLVCRK